MMCKETPLEHQTRFHETTCPGCGTPKMLGDLMCWDCFKSPDHPNPYKYAGGITLDQWLSDNGRVAI